MVSIICDPLELRKHVPECTGLYRNVPETCAETCMQIREVIALTVYKLVGYSADCIQNRELF